MAEFEKEVMKYLRNITRKLISLDEKMKAMESKTQQLGAGCARAFEMCRVVISSLAENQQDLADEFSEYSGVIQESTWA